MIIEHPVMVKAAGKPKLVKLCTDISLYRLRGGEIHRCTLNRCHITVRNRILVGRCKAVSIDPHYLIHGISAVISVEIEVSMICHIENRILIGSTCIVNAETVILCQCICHGNPGFSGEALISVRGNK